MTFIFAMFVKEAPEAMQELDSHLWHELKLIYSAN